MRVLFSFLARDQLRELAVGPRRALLRAVREQLTVFPRSGSPMTNLGPGFRQVIRSGYRMIYRYDEEGDEIRIYFVAHGRRGLPPPDLLRHQAF